MPRAARSEKTRFSRKPMNSLCFFDILRVRGVQNLIIFGPGGDFFDVRKSSRIFHRFLRPKVRKVGDLGLHLGACGRHFANFLDNCFDLGKKLKNHEKRILKEEWEEWSGGSWALIKKQSFILRHYKTKTRTKTRT